MSLCIECNPWEFDTQREYAELGAQLRVKTAALPLDVREASEMERQGLNPTLSA